jgi:hypothetical protein
MRRLQFQLSPNAFLVCWNCWIYKNVRILIPDDEDGGSSSTSPASGHPNATLAVPQPGDSVDVSQPAYSHKPRTEEVSKNYIIHETSQDESATRPPWKDTMAAMFGDHVKWEELKAYVSRGRPLCELCIHSSLHFYSDELYSSTCATMFHNGPPRAIYRSPYQDTFCHTSSLSYTHLDFEPRIRLESRTWMLFNPPAKFHPFHDA